MDDEETVRGVSIKQIVTILIGILTAFGGGGVAGYNKRDQEYLHALVRARCKIHALKEFAEPYGWERPTNWCTDLEEQ